MGKFSGEWFKILEVSLAILVLPTLLFSLLGSRWPAVLFVSYHFVVGLFLFQSALSYWYTTCVFTRKRYLPPPSAEMKPLPMTTFIVSAYLPNETAVVESTLLNILKNVERPSDGIEVILAYNTPHMEPVELRLRELAYQWPELVLCNAYKSRSKSENLNYAIDFASGALIVLVDADHLVASDCLTRAWRWMNGGYDVVQGLCKVRNSGRSFIAKTVGVEFEIIYGINHPSRSIVFDTSLFGGSNGYWKAEVLKKVRFKENMLTEDIDSTLRGILAGYRFVHDKTIVSTELAPLTVRGLWFQRKRWAQGWFQCSLKYQGAVLRTRYLNGAQKFLWSTLLLWRIFYDGCSSLLFPIVFAYWLCAGRIQLPVDGYILFAFFFTMLNGPYQTVIAFKNAAKPRAPAWDYLLYCFTVFFYTIFKTLVHLVAIRDEMAGEKSWVVSKRSVG